MSTALSPSSQKTDILTTQDVPQNIDHEKNASDAPDTKAWKQHNNAPDGGLVGWPVVLGAWCVLFCSFGWLNSIGSFQSFYERDLLHQYSASTIAWIPSLQILFIYVMGPVVGGLYDHFGPRWLVLCGSILHIFGLMMASISTEYYQVLLSQGVCSALGVAIIFQPATSVIPQWFNRKRAVAYGLTTSGGSIGGVIFPILLQRLISNLGYGWAMRIAAFLILFLLIIANLTIRAHVPPNPRPMTKEELVQPFKEPTMVLVLLGFMLLTFGGFIPIDYVVIQAMTEIHMSPSLAQYLLAILNAGSLFGRLSSGLVADRIGPYNVFVLVCYLAGILELALWIPASSNTAIIVFAVLFGFASGAYVALCAALIVKISPFQQIGYRIGLIFLCSSASGLTTNPIAGAILSHNGGSYLGMKIFAGVLLLVGTTLVLAARLHQTGPRLLAEF